MMTSRQSYSTLADDLLESLNCPICRERYDTPKILQCYHVFCKKCLDTHIQIQDSNFPPCPICRHRISYIPEKGADSFPTLTFFQDLINSIKATEKTLSADVCNACNTSDVQIENVCLNCDKKLCCHCTLIHGSFTQFTDHTVMSKEEYENAQKSEILSKRSVFCRKHVENSLSLYCSSCNVVLCVSCVLIHHSGHPVKDLSDRVTECRNKIDCIDEDLIVRIRDGEKKIESVATALMTFQTNVYETEQNIIRHFERKAELVESSKNNMLSQLRNKSDEIQKRFLSERDIIELQKTQSESLRDFIRVVREYSCALDLVNQTNIIEEKWKECEDITHGFEKLEVNIAFIPSDDIESSIISNQGDIKVEQVVSIHSAFKVSKVSNESDIISMSANPSVVTTLSYSPSFYNYDLEFGVYGYGGKRYFNKFGSKTDDISYLETVVEDENANSISKMFVVNHSEGRTKAVVLSEKGDQLHHFYLDCMPTCIAANPNGGVFLYNPWEGLVLHNLTGKVLRKIKSVSGKPVAKLIAANKIGDVVLVGESDKEELFCKIITIDGKIEFEHKINKSNGPWTFPVEAKALSIDDYGNVLICLGCSRKETRSTFIFKTEKTVHERHLFLLSKDGRRRESLTLPKSLGSFLDVKNMTLKADGHLLLAVQSGSSLNIITSRYLP